MSYTRLGQKEKRHELVEMELKIFPQYLFKHPDDARAHLFFATTLIEAGRVKEAKSEAATAMELNPNDPLMLYNLACFYSMMNEKELAIDSLERSINAGHVDYEWFKRDPDLENIRNEPKYLELLKDK